MENGLDVDRELASHSFNREARTALVYYHDMLAIQFGRLRGLDLNLSGGVATFRFRQKKQVYNLLHSIEEYVSPHLYGDEYWHSVGLRLANLGMLRAEFVIANNPNLRRLGLNLSIFLD
jgi:hypothetical protein